MSERIMTLRELNRATLARQMLLERAIMSAQQVTEQLVGLQAQFAKPPYIGLWARLHDFQHSELTQLIERRQAVRATMMRSTLHLMTSEDYLLLRAILQPALTRALHSFFGPNARTIDTAHLVEIARPYIQEQPRTFAQIRDYLSKLFPDTDPALLAYVIRTHLPLVQIAPGGAWNFTGNPAHALAEEWLGRSLIAAEQGLRTIILRYLAAFGPATVKDIQVWSGLPRLQNAVEEIKSELVTLRDEKGNLLYDLPDSPRPSEQSDAPPRFLPDYDNLILSHADRRRFIADADRPAVFLSAGRIQPTILVDGFVRGIWKIERVRDVARLSITPFEPLPEETQAALTAEGERLLRFAEEDATQYEVEFR